MNDVLIDLSRDELAEIKFLLRLRREIVSLRCQIVGVLIRHQVEVMHFDIFDNFGTLYTVAMLKQRLQDTASVMLKAQLIVLGANQFEAFLNDCMLLLVRYLRLLLLYQELVVVYLYGDLYETMRTLSLLIRSDTFYF